MVGYLYIITQIQYDNAMRKIIMGVVNTEDYMDMWLLLWEKRTTKYIYILCFTTNSYTALYNMSFYLCSRKIYYFLKTPVTPQSGGD